METIGSISLLDKTYPITEPHVYIM